MTIDLANAAILVHPYEDEDGSFGAQMTIRLDTFQEQNRDADKRRSGGGSRHKRSADESKEMPQSYEEDGETDEP